MNAGFNKPERVSRNVDHRRNFQALHGNMGGCRRSWNSNIRKTHGLSTVSPLKLATDSQINIEPAHEFGSRSLEDEFLLQKVLAIFKVYDHIILSLGL